MNSINQSRMFAILLQLEEQEKRYNDRISELKPYKMAAGAKNLLWLLECEVKGTRHILEYMRETFSTKE